MRTIHFYTEKISSRDSTQRLAKFEYMYTTLGLLYIYIL